MGYTKVPTATNKYYFTTPMGLSVTTFTPTSFKTWGGRTYHCEQTVRLMRKRHPELTIHNA